MDEVKCDRVSEYEYYWPGKPARYCCHEHAQQLTGIAHVLGFHLALVPNTDEFCGQILSQEEIERRRNGK